MKINVPNYGIGIITTSSWCHDKDDYFVHIKFKNQAKSVMFKYSQIKNCKLIDKEKFSKLKYGTKFEYNGFKMIRCETITDVSNQTWNAVDLRNGVLFRVKNSAMVHL